MIRFHPENRFERDTSRACASSRDADGRERIDEWGWPGSATSKPRLYVRRSRLQRPVEEEVIVITDLLDETRFSAADLLAASLERRGIERVLQQITEVFPLQHWIGSTPEATIFQGAFCLMLDNLLQTVRQQAAAAPTTRCAVESLSTEEIFRDATRPLTCVTELIRPATLTGLIPASRSMSDLKTCLAKLLSHPIPRLWWKTTRQRHRKKTPTPEQSGAHTSVAKLLTAAASR